MPDNVLHGTSTPFTRPGLAQVVLEWRREVTMPSSIARSLRCVAAFGAVALSIGSVSACSASTSDTPSPPPRQIQDVRIEGVKATQPDHWLVDGSNWEISIEWDEPAVPVDHFEVRRDGIVVASQVSGLSFTDAGVEPGERFHYEVVGVDAGASSLPGRLTVGSGEISLADARFRGRYDVKMVPVEWSSSTVEPEARTARFIFRPECTPAVWSCDVSWDEYYGTAEGTLERSGVTYSGTAFGTLNLADCRTGEFRDVRLEIEVDVLRAGGVDGWFVDDFRGTIKESAPATADCEAGSITWRIGL
jgi:hypothetical protein